MESTPGEHGPAPAVANTAIAPSPEVRAELEAVLDADESLLGEVWRRTQAGETPEQIQAARGAQLPNFVWTYRRIIESLLEGNLPTAPTVALGVARRYRSLLRRVTFSTAADDYLRRSLAVLERVASNEEARQVEDRDALKATVEVEAQAIPGIYVYALPHYLRHPYDDDSGRTLFKVGHSNRSSIERFRQQTRTTALPEDPVLLRVYPTPPESSAAVERQFHVLLEAADHDRSAARTGGREWFLTSLRFLDAIADVMGLETRRVGELDTVEL